MSDLVQCVCVPCEEYQFEWSTLIHVWAPLVCMVIGGSNEEKMILSVEGSRSLGE